MLSEYEEIRNAANTGNRKKNIFDYLRPPSVLYHSNPTLKKPETGMLFDHRGPGTLLLNLGGGPVRYSDQEIILNLKPFHNVDLVGDAHAVPVIDDTFDSVICNAVVEHVFEPEKVVKEMIRVLKPGGYLYAEVPFIFFFHGYPNDYRRYTREGVKLLFSDLDIVRTGITNGPVSAMLLSLNILLQMFVPPKRKRLRKAVNGLYRLLVFPLKYIDAIMVKNPEAHFLSGGFYLLGRKRPELGDKLQNPDGNE